MEIDVSFSEYLTMVLESKSVNEKKANDEEIEDALSKLKGHDKEILRIALMDRARADKDEFFYQEYFYGKEKDRSKRQNKTMLSFMKSLDNWTTEEDVLRVILKS